MLKLVDIKKDYKVADSVVNALKGVSFCFRKNEFVSILGPSGCGKTTLLNIIGGLDKYSSGDMSILGKSTKKFTDKDWDVYRNRSIGFVFQSYNLIPHQTVLGNVELALTIAGMNKTERAEKAKAALDKVGLSDQYYKKPNQLSGGQCQRVAIARALVNDPEIILADEPTGALDTKTSKQIMELIKEVAKEHLVIMVTHNPELAEEYSTRIIKLLDGELLSDSMPFSEEEELREVEAELIKKAEKDKLNIQNLEVIKDTNETTINKTKKPKKEKAKMSFFTALKLSLQNLFSKKGRTIMTSIAGSIGIIGVSLVLSVSFGFQGYLNRLQNDMLSGNPIEISRSAFDINSISGVMSFGEQLDLASKNDWVDIRSMMAELVERADSMQNMMVQNTITQDYVEYIKNMNQEWLAATMLNYGLDVSNSIYTDYNIRSGNSKNTSLSSIRAIYSSILEEMENFSQYAPLIDQVAASFSQLPNTKDSKTEQYMLSQYNVIHKAANTNGIAKNKDEVMIVLGQDRTLTDLLLAQLGYYTQDEFINLINKVSGNPYDEDMYEATKKIDYDVLMGKTFKWYPNDNIFKIKNQMQIAMDMASPITVVDDSNPSKIKTVDYLNVGSIGYNATNVTGDGLEFKIIGIVEPKEDLSYGMLNNGFYYTTDFAEYAIEQNYDSEIVQALANGSDTHNSSAMRLPKGFSYTIDDRGTDTTDDDIKIDMPNETVMYTGITYKYSYETAKGEQKQAFGLVGSSNQMLALMGMMSSMRDNGSTSETETDLKEPKIEKSATLSLQQMGANVVLDSNDLYAIPSQIAIYPKDFTQKDFVLKYLDDWNGDGDIEINGKILKATDREKIVYTDMLSLVIGILQTLLNIITWVLVGFTSLALVVTIFMIAIITIVSVVERIKEIGVIRSLGGRKRDIANLFIAETVILGFIAGMIGILITYLISWIINIIVGSISTVTNIAALPIWVAAIMLSVSVLLTLISGIIPAISAAKKNPVVALRTE